MFLSHIDLIQRRKNLLFSLLIPFWKELFQTGLKEDGVFLDWTTLCTISSKQKIKAKIIAKEKGVWAGSGLLQALELLSQEWKSPLKIRSKVQEGKWISKKSVVCEWEGSAQTILAFERTCLNLLAWACGIATQTRRLTEIVNKKKMKYFPRVTATRKILPHYREVALYAVEVGGGFSHRVGLSGGVLIKENHIQAAGSVLQAIQGAKNRAPHGLKIEVEVKSLSELKEALACPLEVVLLDNFSPLQVKQALKIIQNSKPNLIVEVSGGLTEKNIHHYALPGVHVLSVGSLTHSVQAIDFSLLLSP